jgi:hypothetical protein
VRLLPIAAVLTLLCASSSSVVQAQQPRPSGTTQQTAASGIVANCHAEFVQCKREHRRIRYGFDICNYRKSKCNFNAPPGVH